MQLTAPRIKHLNMRMTLYFSLVIIAALSMIVFVISRTFSDRLISEMNVVINQKINLITATLDNTLQEIKALQFAVIHDKGINALLRRADKAGARLRPQDIEELQQDFSSYKQRNTNVTTVFAVSRRRQILDPLYAGAAFQWIVTASPALDVLKKTYSLGIFSAPNSFPLRDSGARSYEKYNLTYYGQYYDYQSYEYLGYIAVNLRKNAIFSDIDPLCRETFDFSCVVDNRGQIVQIFGDDPPRGFLAAPRFLKARRQVVAIGGRNYLLYRQKIKSYPNWTFIGFVNYQQIISRMLIIYKTIFTVCIIVLILIIFLSFYIASKVTNPIRKLSNSMVLLGKGTWPAAVECHTHDEIKELVGGFNNLVLNIKNLTAKIVEEQEAKKRIEVSMVQSQLDLLQSQINPHFIHNTLNTMNYMAKKEGHAELAETIASFNALLRASISQSRSFITVAEEIENLQHYMNIQKHRYDMEIDFSCTVDPEIQSALLPNLILQPLVENALFHGIFPKRGGAVRVVAGQADGELQIAVEDDGAGMTEEVLNAALRGPVADRKGFNSMGLSNVNERLSLYYSDQSRLCITSVPDVGTTISFHIPFGI